MHKHRWVLRGLLMSLIAQAVLASTPPGATLAIPQAGDHALRVLTPTLLELSLVNTKQPDPGRVNTWDWVNDQQAFVAPNMSSVKVFADGETNLVTRIGFKRRALYAPLLYWDLRIGNQLYLRLSKPIPEGATVRVLNDGTLWPTNFTFEATTTPLRYSPAIHVNQEGYLPALPKTGAVGYYLGDLGELSIPTNQFFIVNAITGASVYQGTLTLRPDRGYSYLPMPYQNVYEADFSAFSAPGEYRLMVPGMGASFPFRIDDGIAMDFVRTYALGIYQQRSGTSVSMPYTRFTHGIDHTAPAAVPTNAAGTFGFTWYTISNYCTDINTENPPQIAPILTNYNAQLFPFVKQGTVSVPGGHFEAGDYNRVTYNGAQLIHLLVFASDHLPGVGALDNLGIPESGDGISDLLQEAKWEADFVAKMQDADGAFFYSAYPRDREYELDVLPESGDPQVIWPKNTATTAAAVAALAQCASSAAFKQAFPQAASDYWTKALLGWQFLTNAVTRLGFDGSYQKIQHFDDDFTHRDELAWAACELYLASGDPQFEAKLLEWFPDPAAPATFRWSWRRMFGSYGNAVRDYAFAVTSAKLPASKFRQDYYAKCIAVITNCANDLLQWSRDNAYGTSFPDATKAYEGGGWYFSTSQAFDLAVAAQFSENPQFLDAFLRNLNFEAGCNPVNICYLTGLGWKRQRNVVDQYSLNDRRALPKLGVPVSNIQSGFMPTWVYGWELQGLSYPADWVDAGPYSFYDRWCDDWNVSTEGSTTDSARSLAAVAWLAARTSTAMQSWRSAKATIPALGTRLPAQPVTLTLNVANEDLSTARIIWEAQGQEPVFGSDIYTFVPGRDQGAYWIEADVQWPDGRRAFAASSVYVSPNAPPVLTGPHAPAGGEFSFVLAGTPNATYAIQVSTDFSNWSPLSTNALPVTGELLITDPQGVSSAPRFYRALKVP